jgi:hypothetical protein
VGHVKDDGPEEKECMKPLNLNQSAVTSAANSDDVACLPLKSDTATDSPRDGLNQFRLLPTDVAAKQHGLNYRGKL